MKTKSDVGQTSFRVVLFHNKETKSQLSQCHLKFILITLTLSSELEGLFCFVEISNRILRIVITN